MVDKIQLDEIKTKSVVAMLKALGADKKALIVTAAPEKNIIRSAGNIPGVKTAVVNAISTYDILNYDKLIIAKDAVAKLEEVYA